MDLRSLKYFVSVFEQQSISAAAKSCFVAQPSISAAIKQLEQTLSSRLFNRHARGVKPTAAGEQLYPLALKLLSEAEAIKSTFHINSRTLPFRLGLIRALGVARMSDLLKELTTSIEGLELTLVAPEDEADARIITRASLRSNEIFQPMWHDTYLLALPVGHPLCVKNEIELEDFDNLSMVLRSPCDAWSLLSQALSERKMTVHSRANIQSVEYAVGLVEAGLGCALVPNIEPITAMNQVILRPITGIKLTRTIGLAYDKKLSPSPALEQLKRICRQQQKRRYF